MKILLAIVAAFFLLALVGCGGPPREVRVAIEQTAGGLVIADELVADEVERRGEEMRAQVRQERRDGMIAGDDVETIVVASRARWEELMEPTTNARRVLRALVHRDEQTGRPTGALATLEAAVDAWEAGTGDAVSFAQVAACAGVALADVVGVLEGAEIEVPELLTTGAGLLRGFAVAVCSEGN